MSDQPRKEIVSHVTPETFFGIAIALILGILLVAGFMS
jgi:hypothetical protein